MVEAMTQCLRNLVDGVQMQTQPQRYLVKIVRPHRHRHLHHFRRHHHFRRIRCRLCLRNFRHHNLDRRTNFQCLCRPHSYYIIRFSYSYISLDTHWTFSV